MKCQYTHKFIVDEYGRPGGFYSLSDLPIAGHKELTRDGTIIASDSTQELFEVEDEEKGWVFTVPWDKVTPNFPVEEQK
jgi:hypothetical protein